MSDYSQGKLNPGQWQNDKDAMEAALSEKVRLEKKRRKKREQKKRAQERKKEAQAKSLLKEEGEIPKEGEAAEKEDLDRRVKKETTPSIAASATVEEEDDSVDEGVMQALQDRWEEDRQARIYAGSGGGGAAEEPLLEVTEVALRSVSLSPKIFERMEEFWTQPKMKWDDFVVLMESPGIGFSMVSNGGSKYRFVRKATEEGHSKKSFVAHKPHASYQERKIGHFDLARLRRVFEEKLDWSLDRFVPKGA